jgi:hypothetical protein
MFIPPMSFVGDMCTEIQNLFLTHAISGEDDGGQDEAEKWDKGLNVFVYG